MRECDQNRGLRMGERQLCSPQHPPLKYPGWSADDALWDRGDGRSACVGSALSERGGGPYLARHARDLIARRLSRGKPQGAPGRSRSALHSAPQWNTGREHVPAPSPRNRRRVRRSGAQWVVGISGGDGNRRRCGGRAVAVRWPRVVNVPLGVRPTQLRARHALLGAGFVVWAPTCVGAESGEPAPSDEKWRSVGGGGERRRRGTDAGAVPVR